MRKLDVPDIPPFQNSVHAFRHLAKCSKDVGPPAEPGAVGHSGHQPRRCRVPAGARRAEPVEHLVRVSCQVGQVEHGLLDSRPGRGLGRMRCRGNPFRPVHDNGRQPVPAIVIRAPDMSWPWNRDVGGLNAAASDAVEFGRGEVGKDGVGSATKERSPRRGTSGERAGEPGVDTRIQVPPAATAQQVIDGGVRQLAFGDLPPGQQPRLARKQLAAAGREVDGHQERVAPPRAARAPRGSAGGYAAVAALGLWTSGQKVSAAAYNPPPS